MHVVYNNIIIFTACYCGFFLLGVFNNVGFEKYGVSASDLHLAEIYYSFTVFFFILGLFIYKIFIFKSVKVPWIRLDAGKNLLALLAWVVVLNYLLAGQYIISGSDRGALRISFGFFGPIRKLVIYYLPVYVSALVGYHYFVSKNTSGRKFMLQVLLLMITGGLTGYKANAVVYLIPMFLYASLSLRNLVASFAIVSVAVYLSIYVTQVFIVQGELGEVGSYLWTRATSGLAWGALAAFSLDYSTYYMGMLNLFGSSIASNVFDLSLFQVDAGRHITLEAVGPHVSVLDGSYNLTLSIFGELWYYFGWYGVGISGLTGLFFGFIVNVSLTLDSKGLRGFGGFVFIAFLFPIINSGGLFSIFSFFNFFYLMSTLAILQLAKRRFR